MRRRRGAASVQVGGARLWSDTPNIHEGTMTLARCTALALAVAGVLAASSSAAQTLDKVSFGTNWLAEAEHGGHYQALVDGTYRRYGLDVTIVPGGPNVNNRILLPVGKLDFFMSANTLQGFDAVEQNIPTLGSCCDVPEGPADPDGASRSGHRQVRGPEEADAVHLQGGAGELLPMAQGGFRFQRSQGEALHLQSAAVSCRQAQRDAGLRDVGALRGRKGGGLQAENLFDRRPGLQ